MKENLKDYHKVIKVNLASNPVQELCSNINGLFNLMKMCEYFRKTIVLSSPASQYVNCLFKHWKQSDN